MKYWHQATKGWTGSQRRLLTTMITAFGGKNWVFSILLYIVNAPPSGKTSQSMLSGNCLDEAGL